MRGVISLIILYDLLSLIRATIPGVPLSNRKAFMEGLTGLTLVEFYSPHCGHCRKYTETLERVASTLPTDPLLSAIRFEQFSCKGGPWCRELGLQRIPTLRLYSEDELIGELEGQQKYATIMSWLRKAIEYVPLPFSLPSAPELEAEASTNQDICNSVTLTPTCSPAHTFGMPVTSSGWGGTPTLSHGTYSIVTSPIPIGGSNPTLTLPCGPVTYTTANSPGIPLHYNPTTIAIYGHSSIEVLSSYREISSHGAEVYGTFSYSSLPYSRCVPSSSVGVTLTTSPTLTVTFTPTPAPLRTKNHFPLKHH